MTLYKYKVYSDAKSLGVLFAYLPGNKDLQINIMIGGWALIMGLCWGERKDNG